MQLVHVELKEANAFVEFLHRHHKRIQGHRFSLGAMKHGRLVGVSIIGRPVSGKNQSEWVEVSRLCTDGTANACSFLYAASARAAKALGFEKIQTYILADEPGTSLEAAGWIFERMSHPVGWHRGPDADSAVGPRKARKVASHLSAQKQLWSKILAPKQQQLWDKVLPWMSIH